MAFMATACMFPDKGPLEFGLKDDKEAVASTSPINKEQFLVTISNNV
jgi:hypothetical protein